MLFLVSMPGLIRHLWQLETAVFQHGGLIRAVLLNDVSNAADDLLFKLVGDKENMFSLLLFRLVSML
jgi:hypothetical protein